MSRWVWLGFIVLILIAIAVWKLPQRLSTSPEQPSSQELLPPEEAQPIRDATDNRTEEIELLFRSGDLQLSGTLTLPAESEGPIPAVLFISDAGTVDRNGNGVGVNVDFLKVLAHRLAALGVASFRYDKRGVGASEGKVYEASFQDLVADASEALKVLKSRVEIDSERLFLLGHGEGAEIASLLAAAEKGLRGLILVAGPARPLDQIRLDRIRLRGELSRWSKKRLTERLDQERDFIAFVKRSQGGWADYSFERMKELLPWLDYQQFLVLRVFSLNWYREHFSHDPADTISKLRVPLLILQGKKDHLIPAEEADLLAEAARKGGNTDVVVKVLPDLNHLIRPSKEISLHEFHLDQPVDERVLHLIEEWILKRLGD